MSTFDSKPSEATLGEFGLWQELLSEAGTAFLAAEDALTVAEQREAARLARRAAGFNPNSVGRG